MSHLLIDAEELIMALEYHGHESQYFLDLQTGEVLFLVDEAYVGPNEELEMQIEAEPDRYRAIDPFPSSVGWQVMAEFIEQLPISEARERLPRAIERSHPFRQFKDMLLDYPKIREQWFAFHERAMLQLAREWLEDEGIEGELKLRVGGEA
jgi:hypothetical protein